MIKIVFKKHVHSCFASMSSNDVYLHYEMELPFVPQVGMEIVDGDFYATVDTLCWKDGVLWVFTEADKELYNHQLHKQEGKPRTVEEVVDDWKDSGWKVSKGVRSV